MHVLIHDLAQLVIRSEILSLDDDDAKKISKEVHHVSLFNSMNLKLKGLEVKHMRTFLSILIHRKFESGVSIKGFSNFKCLLVLSLNEFNIKKVPKSLGKLTHRFSNFKWLLVLSLNEFNIEKVPKSLGKLTHRMSKMETSIVKDGGSNY